MRRNEFLDFSKGMLILLVVIGHAIQYVAYQDKGFWQDPIFKAIYIFHMPLFMAIAGYLSYRGIAGSTNLSLHIKSRAISYLLPIFSWAIIYQVTSFVLDDQLKIKKLPLAIIREALTSLWFLWALLGSLCLVAVAQMAGRYRSAILFFFVLAILFLPAVSHLYLFEYTFPFFIGGFLVAHVGDRIVAMPPKLLIGIVLALLTSGCYVLWEDNTYIYVTKMTLSIDNLPNILFRWVAGAIVSVFILLLLFQAYRAASARIRGVFISLGQDSIFIYILQGYAFQILTKVFIYQSISFSTLIVGDIFAVILGVLVTWCCWFLGQSLARNQAVARVLFGRMRKIQIESKMM